MAQTETVTVVFTDLVGSTELASHLGHDAYETVRRAHFDALRAAVLRHHGSEVKTTGDGLMLCFASAADAVGCAIAMQQASESLARQNGSRRLQIRVGASTGEATREDNDLYGSPVVEAARLCAAASAEQILVSHVLRSLARGRGYTFVSVGDLDLKGLPEPLPSCEVKWEPVARSGGPVPLPTKIATTAPFKLVGREQEQVTLAKSWEAAKQGTRQIVLLAGEPGIGKTRLAAETARAAYNDGALVLFGSCDEEISLPYRPVVEAVRHYVMHAPAEALAAHVRDHKGELVRIAPELSQRVPDLPKPQVAEAETERYLMFEAVTGLLAAASQRAPLILILDDLQWAGAPELLLLKHLVRSGVPARMMIIGTYRDSELSRTHPLTLTLADLRRESGFQRIALRGLSEEGVIALVTATAGHDLDEAGLALARAIHRETEGSPLFVGEILRNLAESGAIFRKDHRWTYSGDVASLGIPEGVREAIGRRLARLSESTNKVLTQAAVIGREFDLDLLTRIAEISEDDILDAIDEAKAAALVEEEPGNTERFAFTHALIRTTLYDELTGARRARMHRRVGEALEQLSGARPGDRINELAYHWLAATKASDTGRAIQYARLAGDRALAGLAFEEAASYYDQALSVLEPHDREDEILRCDLLLALGDAQRRAGNSSYRETVKKAVAVARPLGDPKRLALAALGHARASGYHANSNLVDTSLRSLYDEAIAALGQEDSPLRARLQAHYAVDFVFSGEWDRRDQLSREAVEIARRLGDKPTLSQALNARLSAINVPATLSERIALVEELDGVAESLDSLEMRFQAAYHATGALVESGKIGAAEEMITRMEDYATRLRQPTNLFFAALARTMLLIMRGAAEAEQHVMRTFQIGQAGGQPDASSWFASQLAAVRRDQGRYGELTEVMRATAESLPHIRSFRVALAGLYCETGQLDEARKQLEIIVADGLHPPLDWGWVAGMSILARVCAELHDRDAAALLYPQLKPFSHQVGVTAVITLCYGSFALPCGLLAACLGLWEEAERHFQEALTMNERIGARPFHVGSRRAYASMLLERNFSGDSTRAAELIAPALVEAQELGMAREVERLRALQNKLESLTRMGASTEMAPTV